MKKLSQKRGSFFCFWKFCFLFQNMEFFQNLKIQFETESN